MPIFKIGYINPFVRNFTDSFAFFFSDTLDLELLTREDEYGYASFQAVAVSFAVVQTDDENLVGRHNGIGSIVADIDAAYSALCDKGVQFTKPDPSDLLNSIEEHHVTEFFLPPTVIYRLLEMPDIEARDCSSIRYFMYGTAPTSVEKLK